jgi:polyhydroxyalkanoate synthase
MAQSKSGARSRPTAKSKAGPAKTKGRSRTKAEAKAKGAAARKAPAPPPQQPEAAPAGPGPASLPAGAATPEQLAALQELSANLARAAMIAQGAFAEAALKGAEPPSVVAADPFRVGAALSGVVGRLAAQPDKVLKAQADLFSGYLNLWQATAMRLAGQPAEPVVTPERGDKRFTDPEWSQNPVFDVIKQAYLLSANWLNGLVAGVGDIDPQEKRRIEFFTKALTDAFSPSNFLLSNPAALKEAMATRGESLVKGMENFAADLQRGGGQLAISQTDLSKFEVGVNVAATPGKVVFQNELFQLIQFAPRTDKVHERPLVIFPPWINKYYILDLRPENSMIRWLAEQGHTVFVVSWVNPDPRLAHKTFEDYILEGAFVAIEQALAQTGADKVNAVGYCIAGTMMSCALALMAAHGDDRIASTTFFAAQQDFSQSGDLKLFTDEDWLRVIEVSMDRAGGVLPGSAMAGTFNALRANDLIWSFFVNNYLMGKDPKPFDLLYWNADQTRMPRALHLFYLREFYQANRLARGELEIAGERLDLGKVKVPIYAQAAREDHIAPYRSVYRGARLFGGPVTFTLAGSGHIAGVVNPPAAGKYQHWTNPDLPPNVDEWLAEAQEHPGSWWPHWAAWLQDKAGKMVKARDPAAGPLKPIEDAPGSYVKVKS